MRIAYLVASKFYGGVEKIACDSLNALCVRHDVLLILPKGFIFWDKILPNVKVCEYTNFDKRYNPLLYIEILQILKKFKAEIFHTHGMKATQMGFLINKILPIKFIASKHNDRKAGIFRHIKNVIGHSRKICASVPHTRFLHFGITPQILQKSLPQINPFVISVIGMLDGIKVFDELIKARARLEFDYVLQIVGSGNELENLKKLARNLGNSNYVEFLGFSNMIAEILNNSFLRVVSSKSEGLGLVLIEGLLYYMIMILRNVGIASEILPSDFIFDYTKLSDKIGEIYSNYDKFFYKICQIQQNKKGEYLFLSYIQNLENYYKELA
ncbi:MULTISPECIES: glycosyltransferase [unclassified Campylobacter]|uniref:glycosyltransferase n=1 Tax=unclassified Campylobacter TaxID=2593542 RepID=UPI0022EA094E|nr:MULTISPECIES: glycosyltransferase [unclassified Campylobacter]MDA3061758.1 glycosyltransferase [Campylobacter sp. JMF_14 EL1]MDA3073136.1 glycosyltransferase [Campylobacter sp. JMF_10 EL2]